MQVFISSGAEEFKNPWGLGYRPLLWDGENVYIGNNTQTHFLLSEEFGVEYPDNWDDRPEEGMFFLGGNREGEIKWRGSETEPYSGVDDAILEALGVPNTFMSKQAGWNDVMQWSGDALDWVSEKGLDADAAMHSRIHPEGCDDNECWVCNEGQRPKRFETPDVE